MESASLSRHDALVTEGSKPASAAVQSLDQRMTDFNQLEREFDRSEHTAFYVVIRNRSLYNELVELNRAAGYRHRWFHASEPTDAASERTALTAEEDVEEFGAIRLEQPMFLYEKKREGYTGSFLFGRSVRKNRFVDFAFAREKTVSKVSFGLFYSWEFDNNWMIQCEGGSIIVNKVLMNKHSDPFGFNPRAANIVQLIIPTMESGIRTTRTLLLEFHCNPCFSQIDDFSMHLASNLRLDRTDDSHRLNSTTASSTTMQNSVKQLGGTEALYLFGDTFWKSRRGSHITYTLAMDPWTCKLFIAKPYAEKDLANLEERLCVFEKLRVSTKSPYQREILTGILAP